MHKLSQGFLHHIHCIFTMVEQLHGDTKALIGQRLQVSIL